MDFNTFTAQYGGWIGLLLYFLYNQVWPFVSKRSMSGVEFERQMETRRIAAQEKVSEAMNVMSVSMAQTNERIATILANQALMFSKQEATHSMLADALGDMKAAAGTSKRKGD